MNIFLFPLIVVVIFIFIKNWFNECYNTTQSQCLFYKQGIIRINFDFHKIVRKNVCDTAFKTYKTFNSVVNSVKFSSARQC